MASRRSGSAALNAGTPQRHKGLLLVDSENREGERHATERTPIYKKDQILKKENTRTFRQHQRRWIIVAKTMKTSGYNSAQRCAAR